MNGRLIEYARFTSRLMGQHGLHNWQFAYNNRIQTLGVCFHEEQRIELSTNFVMLNNHGKIQDVALHEIAHALVGIGHGHDHVWRAKAVEIGCSAMRCQQSVSPPYKYRAKCPSCGRCFYRYRQVYNMAKGDFQYCIDCGKIDGRLVYIRGNYPVRL